MITLKEAKWSSWVHTFKFWLGGTGWIIFSYFTYIDLFILFYILFFILHHLEGRRKSSSCIHSCKVLKGWVDYFVFVLSFHWLFLCTIQAIHVKPEKKLASWKAKLVPLDRVWLHFSGYLYHHKKKKKKPNQSAKRWFWGQLFWAGVWYYSKGLDSKPRGQRAEDTVWITKPYGCRPTKSAMFEDLEVCFKNKIEKALIFLTLSLRPDDVMFSWRNIVNWIKKQ